jgi:hypothetical protein
VFILTRWLTHSPIYGLPLLHELSGLHIRPLYCVSLLHYGKERPVGAKKGFILQNSNRFWSSTIIVSHFKFNVHTVHIKRIRRKNQQYALIVPSCIYLYVLAPTCFGSSLPSSGSLLDPPELLEKHNRGLVYHITCGYVACVPDCRGSVCCVSQLCFSSNSGGSNKLPDDGRLLPKHVGANT